MLKSLFLFFGLVAVVLIIGVFGLMPDKPELKLNSQPELKKQLVPESASLGSVNDSWGQEMVSSSGGVFEKYPYDRIKDDSLSVRCEIVPCDPKILFEDRFRQLKAKEPDTTSGQSSVKSIDDLEKIVRRNSENFKQKDGFSNDPLVYRNPF